ncbi:hypothetical protein FC70_GL000481 [Paucilactobacillus oligofermentans DSM 15707 = LMG 22743]|uniref:Integral membrane protein n=2 Tax=Paucilactobacillus oligofermentans TaxID=293371 RepID=A0A0R1RM60_9LACO|nr:hypothetical protein FC70_GL000481 [Paucilactobacillus oligofermentans DSM 15707 = LMG 22743]
MQTKSVDGINAKHIMVDYQHLLLYLQNPLTGDLKFRYLPMSHAGSNHFNDVRKLFVINNLVMVVTVPLSVWLLRQEKRNQQLWKLLVPLQTGVFVFPVLAVTLGLNFESAFIKFHELIFNNNDWQFNPTTDPIINVLTESIFFQLAVIVVLLIEVMMYLSYRITKRQVFKT